MKKVRVVYATGKVGAALLEPIPSGDHVGGSGERSDLEVIAPDPVATLRGLNNNNVRATLMQPQICIDVGASLGSPAPDTRRSKCQNF